jgi:hypothetical protein
MTNRGAVHSGHLVLADISGYTAFLAGTELEHAQGILQELTALLVANLCPPLRFVKLEGDAVFAYAPEGALSEEALLDLTEACYFEFANRLRDMQQQTTCTCAACRAVPTLDLKFVAHRGSFVLQRLGGSEDLAGPDVILAHRLLKNSVTERFGCRAYALFTAACLEGMPAGLSLAEHVETYEHFGEVPARVHDLEPVLAARREATRVYIGGRDADLQFTYELPVPPTVAWPYFVEPGKRLRWEGLTGLEAEPNKDGRLGLGAASHCAHGSWSSVVRYIDWRPYGYFTATLVPTSGGFSAAPPLTQTFEFKATENGGCLVEYRARLERRSWFARTQMRLFAPFVRRDFAAHARKLNEVIAEDLGAAAGARDDREPPRDPPA